MKRFSEHIKTGKYVSAYFDSNTNKKMIDWATQHGFDLSLTYDGKTRDPSKFKFHTTIIYSNNYVDLKNGLVIKRLTSTPIRFELFGEDKDIPVILVKSTELELARKTVEQLGLKDSWPTYRPHVSLSYKKQKYDLSKLELPPFEFNYDRIRIEDV
jgi:2'-5' RNA ligase